MKTIWKYPMPLAEFNNSESSMNVMLRQGFNILDVQMQSGEPTMWVELDPQAPVEKCELVIVGTGQHVPAHANRYLATAQDGMFVWHFYLRLV